MNLDFKLDDDTLIKEDLVTVTINVLRHSTSIENIRNTSFHASIIDNMFRIESPQSELITIYSVMGIRLYSGLKNAGWVEIPCSLPQGSLFIVKGSLSGVIKIVK